MIHQSLTNTRWHLLSPELNMMRCCMRVCLSSSHLLLLSSSRSIRTRDACYRANPKQHVTPMHPAPPPPNVPVPVSPGGWMDHGSRARAIARRHPHSATVLYVRYTWLCPAGPTPSSAFQLSVSSEWFMHRIFLPKTRESSADPTLQLNSLISRN